MKITIKFKLFICAMLLNIMAFAKNSIEEVKYVSNAIRYAEYIELLKMALDKTVDQYGPFSMRPYRIEMNEPRFFAEAISGENVNVVWGATSIEREASLIPVRIPLGKGILGYRIGLIKKGTQQQFSTVTSLSDMKKFSFGLGPGWGDVPIYKHAGFPIIISPYEGLFKALSLGRYDYFSRGINEIFDEYEKFKLNDMGIEIEKDILLHYPYPFYFFVSPTKPQLAERIEKGLRVMLDDGSFDKIFMKFNGIAIHAADMDKRKIIDLINPEIPPNTPLTDAKLWYKP